MRISFFGLGNMGAPLAENILRIGESLIIYTRRKELAASFEARGAKAAKDVAELADCDILCTCLPMPEDVVEAAIGKHNLYSLMKPGSVHLEFSTIDPKTANMLANHALQKGIGYVQSVVNKTPQVAAEGNAPFFVGGDADAINMVMPILLKIGKPTNLKTIDAACSVKLLSNLIGMSNVAIVAEGMHIAKLAGLDAFEVLNLLLETGSASYQMQVRGPMMAEGDYVARFGVDLAAKDLRLGCAMAKNLGYVPPMMSKAFEYLQQAHNDGMGAEDVSALFKVTGK